MPPYIWDNDTINKHVNSADTSDLSSESLPLTAVKGPRHLPTPWLIPSLCALAIIAVPVPLLMASNYGALGIPRGDDWSYLVTLFRLVETGSLSFNHWVSMSLVGQLVIAAPIVALAGRNIAALQVLTAMLGFLGLACVLMTTRLAVRAFFGGLLLVGALAVGPLWGTLAVSFMTDIPAFAFCCLAMLLTVDALRRNPVSLGRLYAALAIALVAFTIRQYSVVAFLAAAAAGLWWLHHEDKARAKKLVMATGAFLLVGIVFVLWWNTIPDARSLSPSMPTRHSLVVTFVKGAGFLRLAGLLLLPVVVFAGPLSLVIRSWRASRVLTIFIAGGSTLWLTSSAWRVPSDRFVGNYLLRDGVLSDVVLNGQRPEVLPGNAWVAIVWIATAASIILLIAIVPPVVEAAQRLRAKRWRSKDPIDAFLGLTIAGYAAAYSLAMLTGVQVYDRYLLPALPAIGLVILRIRDRQDAYATAEEGNNHVSRSRIIGASIALGALAFVGAAFSADSASFDGASWRVAQDATNAGWAPDQVYGGLEWRNYHRGEIDDQFAPDATTPSTSTPICVTVHIDPRHVVTPIVAIVESKAPTRRPIRLVAFRTKEPCQIGKRSP